MAERPGKSKAAATDTESTKTQSNSLTVADIKELFVLMKENEIAELNLEQQETKIRIVSTHAPVFQQAPAMHPMMPMMPGVLAPAAHAIPAPVATPAASEATSESASSAETSGEAPAPSNLKTVLSPMVGTFYRSPAPDAPPFVKIGDSVKEDTTLCIIEAMKLMNEIKAEMKGRVYKVLAENGQPVEYNQPICLIEPE